MEIRRLDKNEYAGREITVRYTTSGYLDISPCDGGFALRRMSLAEPMQKSFTDTLFSDWLEAPLAYGAFEGEKLLGIAEGSPESWNNRWRISNICIFEESDRQRGVGSALMERLMAEARRSGARMAVLETQSCNESAVAFYKKHGFEVIGFDLFAYTNDDPTRHEVRIEMGKKLRRDSGRLLL